jgi:hypothetical protein
LLQHEIVPALSRLLALMGRLSNEVFERRSCQRSRPVSDRYRRLALLSSPYDDGEREAVWYGDIMLIERRK